MNLLRAGGLISKYAALGRNADASPLRRLLWAAGGLAIATFIIFGIFGVGQVDVRVHAEQPGIAAMPESTVRGEFGDRVSYSYQGVARKDAVAFAKAVAAALDEVENWWGRVFEGSLRIEIRRKFKISRALLPAWNGDRGLIEFPADRVRNGRAAIFHELVHIVAPNQNRLLAEGLAVYAQELLSAVPVYPNFGRDLHEVAREIADRVDVGVLDEISTPTSLVLEEDTDGRGAYIAGGSFVRFLIQKFGMQRFRKLYSFTPLRPGIEINERAEWRWERVYGKALAELSDEWRAELRRADRSGVNNEEFRATSASQDSVSKRGQRTN